MANKTTVYLMSVIISLLIAAAASETPVTAYTNHTVGGASGWFFDVTTNTSSANFSTWAANETFSLGDYLIFNTNTNQTVIETNNQTTYQNCSVDFSDDDDIFQYGGGNNQLGVPTVIAVALVNEGPSYYFSSASDGIQCLNGMAFEISVQYGLGLPSSLNQPPPPPYAEPPSEEDSPSPPITVDGNQFGSGGVGSGANVRLGLVVLFGVALLMVERVAI